MAVNIAEAKAAYQALKQGNTQPAKDYIATYGSPSGDSSSGSSGSSGSSNTTTISHKKNDISTATNTTPASGAANSTGTNGAVDVFVNNTPTVTTPASSAPVATTPAASTPSRFNTTYKDANGVEHTAYIENGKTYNADGSTPTGSFVVKADNGRYFAKDANGNSSEVNASTYNNYGSARDTFVNSSGGSSSAAGSASLAGAESAYASMNTPYETTYTDSRGNVYTGYIINGKPYADPQGNEEVPIGSYVTDSAGRIWRKGYGNVNDLVYSPLAEDHYDYMTGVDNTKEITFTNPLTGKVNYVTANPDKGYYLVYDSQHNSLGYIDSAGVYHSSTPDSDYDQKTSQAALAAAKAEGYTFDGNGIVKIANGHDMDMNHAYLVNQYADALERGEDGADILAQLGMKYDANGKVVAADGTESGNGLSQTLNTVRTNPAQYSTNGGSGFGSYSGSLGTAAGYDAAMAAYQQLLGDQAELNFANANRSNYNYQPTDYTTQINQIYDQAFSSARAQIQNQLAQGELSIDQAIEKVPAVYEAGMNDMAQQYEINKRNANEYFNANGLSSGARAQAMLAMNNVYQANLADYRLAQANAIQEYEDQRAQLKLEAQSKITEALLQNEQSRAQDLLAEWQRQDQYNFQWLMQKLDDDYRYYALEIDKAVKQASLQEEQRQANINAIINQMKLAEDQRQFEANYGLNVAKLNEEMNEFAQTMQLNYDKLNEDARQADITAALKKGTTSNGTYYGNSDADKANAALDKANSERLQYAYQNAIDDIASTYYTLVNDFQMYQDGEYGAGIDPALIKNTVLQNFVDNHADVQSVAEAETLLKWFESRIS